jgi:hypothetical protein
VSAAAAAAAAVYFMLGEEHIVGKLTWQLLQIRTQFKLS